MFRIVHVEFLHEVHIISVVSSLPAYYFLQRLSFGRYCKMSHEQVDGVGSLSYVCYELHYCQVIFWLYRYIEFGKDAGTNCRIAPCPLPGMVFWYTCYLLLDVCIHPYPLYVILCLMFPVFFRYFGCKKGMINCPCAGLCIFFQRCHLFTSLI